MSNKGGRVSPDYLADIAPEYADRGELKGENFNGFSNFLKQLIDMFDN